MPLHVNIFSAINVLDCLGEVKYLRFVGLRFALNASLAALEWVQYWQCSLSNVGNRLSYKYRDAGCDALVLNLGVRSCPLHWRPDRRW